jgi:hypothetical protein
MEYKKYFITFGAGTPGYNNRVKVLANQANELKWFDYVIGYNGTDLVADNIFWSTHGNFILKNKRGLGYWLWKSYLIKKTLEKMNENDVLLYCDVGCELNQHGKTKLDEYYNIQYAFKTGHVMKDNKLFNGWVHPDLFKYSADIKKIVDFIFPMFLTNKTDEKKSWKTLLTTELFINEHKKPPNNEIINFGNPYILK